MGEEGSTTDTSSEEKPTRSKVGRLLRRYDFEEFGDTLERAWMGEETDRKSLRELAEMFNQRLIKNALREAGQNPLPGEVETIYEGLHDDEVSSGLRQQIRGRLNSYGIDPDSLEGDLVSYQAIRTYLMEVRGVEYSRERKDPLSSSVSKIQSLRGRLQTVTEEQVDGLSGQDEISIGKFRTHVRVQIYCEDCGRQYDVDELLRRGGCHCDRTEQ